MQKKALSTLLFVVALQTVFAQQPLQDTTELTIQKAEELFLQKNLLLLTSKYNVDANRALIQQAKLWDNPVLATDQNVYDRKFFRHNKDNGQVFIQVQQLIRTAGKRTKLAQLAEDNTALAQNQFDDLMRGLRYTLISDLQETNHLLKIKSVYDAEITQVNKLVKGMDEVYKVGNISLKENMRLKALLFSLQNELVNISSQLLPLQSEIKMLLQDQESSFIKPALKYSLPSLIAIQLPSVDSLADLADSNRADLRLAKTQLAFQQHNLIYQKALAKPDVTIGPEYDRLNSYNKNYFGLSVSLPLPLLNKNQGNIKAAQVSIMQQQVQVDYQFAKIKNEVAAAIDRVKFYQSINNPAQLEFSNNYDKLFNNMLKSYVERQINLIDFIDFMDSYKDSKLKLLEQHNNLVKSFIDLNNIINKSIVQF